MTRFALSFVVMIAASPTVAQTFQSCTKSETATISAALHVSKRVALTAAANVGPHEIYERWFGKYAEPNGELVRSNLKAVVTAIRTGAITARCGNVGFSGCARDTYAWVYPDEPYQIHICPNFFNLPSMGEVASGDVRDADDGTREGTIIHEISHFYAVADTLDNCYSRSVCSDMATRQIADALENADSYQYFAEDISYFFGENPDGAPAAALGSK